MLGRRIRLNDPSDIVVARQACREMASDLAFGTADQTRLATAVSELARNAIQYAGKGVCILTTQVAGGERKIHVKVEDHGPGIPDLDRAMEPGFTTSGGLGAGLQGAKRIVHGFHIESEPGHTVVTIMMRQKRT